jgi:ribosome-associated protein
LAHTVVNALEARKGEDIILLDIKEIASFTDYFVICTGTSDRMLSALADAVREAVRETHDKKGRAEGDPDGGWMVVDFGDVVVHLFAAEERHYYRLEDLWNDGKVLLRLQ